MYCVRNITEDLYWVGANDHRLHLFENIHPIPKGVSYNAYLLLDQETVLFDTVDWSAYRQLAENIGINMHTVNKAYSVLKQEGFIKLDRRRGAVIALDVDKLQATRELQEELSVILARGICKNITREEVHDLVDVIYDYYARECKD